MDKLSPEAMARWRAQALDQVRSREPRCADCRSFDTLPLPRPGIYTGDHGVCRVHGATIDNAHTRVCDGWQDNVGPRREGVVLASHLVPVLREACLRLREAAVKHNEHEHKKWASDHTPSDRGILRGAT